MNITAMVMLGAVLVMVTIIFLDIMRTRRKEAVKAAAARTDMRKRDFDFAMTDLKAGLSAPAGKDRH